jgi:glyoxylate/hydroxypyruvate reductase
VSIVIVFNNKDPKPWAEVLQQKLPNVGIEIYPDVVDKAKIDFALCWKPAENVLAEFPNLKVAQSVGASADGIISTQIIKPTVTVTRIVDPQLTADMFEYVLTGIMNYLKNTANYFEDKQAKHWQQKSYKSISNTTICILGIGEIGAYVGNKLSSMGFSVKGWSRTEKQIKHIETFAGKDGLIHALQGSDVLVNLLPLTVETESILSAAILSLLNKNGYLINAGRGQHLVENDLLQLIKDKHIAGALLDVFNVEPLPHEHPFWTNKNITITPHVASITNVLTASDGVVENYNRLQQKENLINIVSIKNGY